jgi:hypothetical protein
MEQHYCLKSLENCYLRTMRTKMTRWSLTKKGLSLNLKKIQKKKKSLKNWSLTKMTRWTMRTMS